jgi:hypothetical protein
LRVAHRYRAKRREDDPVVVQRVNPLPKAKVSPPFIVPPLKIGDLHHAYHLDPNILSAARPVGDVGHQIAGD